MDYSHVSRVHTWDFENACSSIGLGKRMKIEYLTLAESVFYTG